MFLERKRKNLFDGECRTKDNIDAYEKFKGKDLVKVVVDLSTKAIHRIRDAVQDSTDGAPVLMPINKRSTLKTQKYKGGYFKRDTIPKNIDDIKHNDL